jgi:hypothetical protein
VRLNGLFVRNEYVPSDPLVALGLRWDNIGYVMERVLNRRTFHQARLCVCCLLPLGSGPCFFFFVFFLRNRGYSSHYNPAVPGFSKHLAQEHTVGGLEAFEACSCGYPRPASIEQR